jgi:hypothetical protein
MDGWIAGWLDGWIEKCNFSLCILFLGGSNGLFQDVRAICTTATAVNDIQRCSRVPSSGSNRSEITV